MITALAGQSAAQIRKVTALIERGHIAHVEGGQEYLVTASDGVTRYVADAYRQTCSCPAGTQGRTCYHLLAALALDEGISG